jgi:hypothetical protein
MNLPCHSLRLVRQILDKLQDDLKRLLKLVKKWDKSMVARKAMYLVTDMSKVDFLRKRLEWRNNDLHNIVIPHLRDLRMRSLDNEKHREMVRKIGALEKILRDLREDSEVRESRDEKQAQRVNELLEKLLQKNDQTVINEAAASAAASDWKDMQHDLRDAARTSSPLSKREVRAIMDTIKEEAREMQVRLGRMLPAPNETSKDNAGTETNLEANSHVSVSIEADTYETRIGGPPDTTETHPCVETRAIICQRVGSWSIASSILKHHGIPFLYCTGSGFDLSFEQKYYEKSGRVLSVPITITQEERKRVMRYYLMKSLGYELSKEQIDRLREETYNAHKSGQWPDGGVNPHDPHHLWIISSISCLSRVYLTQELVNYLQQQRSDEQEELVWRYV